MEIQQLQCLIEVCRYKSFTKAADKMYMSQSSISKIIASLETEVGVPLLKRNRHHMVMTSAGEYLVERARQILAELEDAEKKTHQIGIGMDGFLNIGIVEELDINGLLPHFLKSFCYNNPTVEVNIFVRSIHSMPELVLTEELDVAFVPNVIDTKRPRLSSIPINRSVPRLYYSADHQKAQKKDLSVDDFLGDPVLMLASSNDNCLTQLEKKGYIFPKKQRVSSIQVMKLYLEANLGVAVLGTSQSFFNSSKVNNIPLPLEDYMVGTDAIRLENSPNPVVELFFAQLDAYLKKRTNRER